jgi:rhodanese-related sulfurtransferase
MLKTAHDLVLAAKANTQEVSLENAMTMLAAAMGKDGVSPLILDVREPGEFASGHLPGAVNVPRGLLEFSLSANPLWQNPDMTVLIYCKTSGRAALAAQTMQSMGYRNVSSLAGGFDAWASDRFPVDQPQALGFE